MSTHLVRRTALALAAAGLAIGLLPGFATAGVPSDVGSAVDPVGDVHRDGDDDISQADYDSVDLRRFDHAVSPGRRATFRLRFVDLSRSAENRAFYGVNAVGRQYGYFLAARRGKVVLVGPDDASPCRGSRSSIDLHREVVRLSVPVRCLAGEDGFRFRGIAVLEKRGGRDLANDVSRNSSRIRVR